MPIFEYQCKKCKLSFEAIIINTGDRAVCPKCGNLKVKKLISMFHICDNPDAIKHNIPDPVPPLEELRGRGTEGYKDKPEASTKLGDYRRSKDKYGNTIWNEKEKLHIDMGRKKNA